MRAPRRHQNPRFPLCRRVVVGVGWALLARAAWAGTPSPGEDATVELPEVVVSGEIESLAAAQRIRREHLEIDDAVVDDDIARLPDLNVADALQRIAGLQIQRDLGEGTAPAIRGLTQMETLVNGREYFTAGNGRNLNFEDVPADLVAGIDVYKTLVPAQLEGGIGGTVDLRTYRPFDFPSQEWLLSARAVHASLAQQTRPQALALGSERWFVPTLGEIGLLVDLSYQERAFREDEKSEGNPLLRSDIVPGRSVVVPNGTSETASLGVRRRAAGTAVLQWRPSEALSLEVDQDLTQLRTYQDSYQVNVEAAPTFQAGSAVLFPGTNDLESITWTQAPISILSFARDMIDRTTQSGAGAQWKNGAFALSADLSRTRSRESLYFCGPVLAATAASFSQNLASNPPATRVVGTDLLDPSNLSFTEIAYRTLPYAGGLDAARFDADVALGGPVLRRLSAGLRLARRDDTNAPGLVFGDAALSDVSASSHSSLLIPDPAPLFPGSGVSSIGAFLVGSLAGAQNATALRAAFGLTGPLPASGSPLGVWEITEHTDAGYVDARLARDEWGLDGDAGVRVVRTAEGVAGSQSVPSNGSIAPIATDSAYWDGLPAANLRWRPRVDWTVRAAASRSITRPDFNELSPSLVLVPNPVNPFLNQGSAGNPELRPVRSDNLDLALERSFSRTSMASLTGFLKHVNGFVTTVTAPEVHDGAVYEVSRPQNGTPANIRGFELAYQSFFGALPAWLKGLGVQANYTFVDSESPNTALGTLAPLQNLSRNSLNLIGLYERGDVSARLAFNWRGPFLSGVQDVVGLGALPITTAAYGWVDASLRWRFTPALTVALEGMNLANTMRRSYFGVQTRPQSDWLDDRQVALALRLSM